MLILISILLFFYWYLFDLSNNFYAVIPHKLYRSSQPTLADIKDWQDKYNIKTILNLRGKDIYQQEEEAINVANYSKTHNIFIHSIELKSSRVLSQKELLNIIDILEQSPKPLLVHCRNGVDRTGLVSALAKILDNQNVASAMQEFIWTKGFLPHREAEILKILLKDYQQWLDQHRLQSNKTHFIQWANTEYKPYYYSAMLEVVEPMRPLNVSAWNLIKVKVTNTSHYIIPFTTDDTSGISLYWCYYSKVQAEQDGQDCRYLEKLYPAIPVELYAASGQAKLVDYNLLPQQSIVLELSIPPIRHDGWYRLELDLLEKGKFKFSSYGNPIVEKDFEAV